MSISAAASSTEAEASAGRPPSRTRRRWIVVAIVLGLVVLAAVGGYLAVGYAAYEDLSVVRTSCGTRDFRAQTPADFEAYDGDRSLVVDTTAYRFTDFQAVEFPSRDPELTIRAWYAPGPAGTRSPTVVVVHGRDSCRRDPVVILPAAMLHRAGFGVLMIDLRNHGESDIDNGRWAGGNKEFRDVLGAWDWLIAQGHDPARIGLYGASLGGGTVTIATGEEPGVAATFEDSGYADFDTALREYVVSRGYPEWVGLAGVLVARLMGETELGSKSPDDEAALLHGRPFAIVHGLADATVQPHQAIDLAAAAYAGGTSVEPWIVPGAEHTQAVLLRPHDYEKRLVAFFTDAIGNPASSD